MALPTGLNDLAKLALLASDSSYFKSDLSGSALAAFLDTTYGVAPQYSVPSGGNKRGRESFYVRIVSSWSVIA